MYRNSSGRSSLSSSSRSKESSNSASRSSRSGASTSSSTRGRSPCPSSPRGRRRHRSPSSSRSSRRSPSPRRSSRRRSPGRRSRSPGRRSRSPGRRSRSPGRRSRSPGRRSRSPGRCSRSPGRHSRSPGRRSPSRHSESSVEQGLRITVGNDHYGIDIPERRKLSDRLGSPVDSLNDVDRDDLAEGPIFSRSLSRPRSLERYSSHEESPSSPFSMRHDEDYRNRDVFLHQSDYSMNYDHLQDLPREPDRDGELLRKSLYPLEERGRDTKRPRYDRDDRVLDASIEPQGFLPGTRNYRKRSLSRSPSPTYLDEDFRELESARRKREEEELSRNLSRELSGSGYMIPGLTNPVQSSEPRYLFRPDEAPAMPKKSILKKRVDDPSVQPEVFSNSSASIKEPPLLSNRPSLPQRSCIAPFSSEVENFLKQFNKNAAAESANKESQGNVHDWRPYSGLQQNTFPFEQNVGSFLKQKEHNESTSEPTDRHSDFLLPHERASQDGSGFSRILGMMADSTSVQEKRRRSLPDIEDEEKFLYGDDDNDVNISSPSTQKLTMSDRKESESQKVSPPSSPNPTVKLETSEESKPEYEKIHDLLKTIGLDIGVAEIGKLAARTQERLHGKKPSHSPDHHSVVSRKPESREMRRSRSDTRSPESSQKRSLSPSGSHSSSKEKSSVPKSEHIKNKTVEQDNSAGTPEQSVPQVSLIPSAPPSLPNLPPTPTAVSQYPVSRFSPFTANQLPQNYPTPPMPPPGYDAYGHYMAYAASGWPMYAPPQQADPALSNVHGLVTLSMPPNPTRPNLRVIETVSTGKRTPEVKKDESVNLVQIPTTAPYSKLLPHQFSPQSSLRGTMERMSDEKNRASQKQKVIEEREKLKAEQETRQKKLQYLRTELDRLSKQQGEMLRKKRREKDGHKDPLLVEVNRLQENIVKEIAQLKMHAEAAEKKQSELDKVAQILGINVFEKSRKQSTDNKDFSEKNKSENTKSQEKTSNSIKESKTSNDKPKGRSPKPTETSQPSKQHFQLANIYDYYDTGNHWCKDCNTICGTMFDFFTHMHNKKHRQTLDPYNRPWASKSQTETKQDLTKRIDKIPVPAKGSEFLIPVTGYYCQLCHEFFGDQISAEQHVKSHPHNEKYKKHLDENPLYEERRNLDRQAGLSVLQETERRLKRKQCEKQKEDKDEKMAKVAKKEEPKGTKQVEERDNENEISKKKDDCNGQKLGTKFKLRNDDKEAEKKKGKKEESPKESRQSSFGKFSWRKSERDEKNQGKDVVANREESTEEGKEKENKSQSGKSYSKPIAIRLSGKTVIPHTSPWTPVVSTSSQAKIRPNLPVPIMVLRKNATATVSKPAPLNTFLSIKSSGATTKPLPVVKEGNPELVLPPDIISKAFGGEVVVLKGSQENEKMPEQAEGQEHERAKEHAKALEHTKASVTKAQEQAMIVAKAQAKARELATIIKEQEVTRTAKINEQPQMFERPHRHHPLLPLPPGPLLPLVPPLPQPSPVLFPPPALLPTKPAAILADDMAPGVSEDDKNMLAMPMYPRPSPPPTVFREHIKKLEKNNSCLAAGNAKDLYDIFYNNSGRSPSDNKFVNIAASDKGKLNPNESERSTDMLADSKPSDSSSTQQSLQDVDNSSDVTKTPLGDGIPGTEEVNVEKMLTACEENVEIESSVKGDFEKISVSDLQSTLKYRETSESNNLPANASVSFHNVDIGTAAPTELSSNPSEFESAVLAMQLPENSGGASFDEVSEKQSELHTAEFKSSYDKQLVTQLSEDNVVPLEDLTKKPLELEAAELLTQLPESSTPSLDEISKNASALETAEFKPSDNKELVIQLSEDNVFPLEEASKYPAELESAESAMHLPESSAPPSDEACRNSLEFDTAEFKSDDDELSTQLSEDNMALLKEVSKKPSELETAEFKSDDDELSARLSEDNMPLLKEVCKKPSELETAEFKSDDEELSARLSEDNMPLLKEVRKKPSELETTEFKSDDEELSARLSEDNMPLLREVCKKPSELETAEFKSDDDELSARLSEDNMPLLKEVLKKPSELETAEFKSDDEELSARLSEDNMPLLKEVRKKPSELETAEFKSDDEELSARLSEDNMPLLKEVCKKPSELETAEFKSDDDELSARLSEDNMPLLKEALKKPSELETAEFKSDDEELSARLSEDNMPLLKEVCKKPSELETAEFKSDDDELSARLSEDNMPLLKEALKKPSELETAEFKSDDDELSARLSEDNMPLLKEVLKKPSELETAEFKSDDDELSARLSEDNMPLLKEVLKKPSELETAAFKSDDEELSARLSEDNMPLLKEVRKKPSELETAEFKSDDDELSTQMSEDNMPLLKEVSKKPSELETLEFKYSADKELAVQIPEHETDISKELVAMSDVGVTSVEDINQKLHNFQEMEVCNESKLKEIKSDLEMNTCVTSLGERDAEKEHLELAEHQLAIIQRDPESQLFEMQIETHKKEGSASTTEKQIDDSFELPISTCVSDMYIHSQVAWEPTDSPKMNEENPQVVMTDHGSFKESSLDLKLGSVGFDGLEVGMCDERPPTSEDPELRPLNSGKLDDFHMNSKEQVLVSSQPKIDEDFDVPKSGEMPDECLANVTMISIDSTLEKCKEISQHPSTCETKDLQVQGSEHLDSISSTNYVKPSSGVELMFLKSGKQGPSESDLTDIEERDSAESENFNLSSIQPEIVQESLDALPTDFGVGHLAEETLNFTGMTPGVINTSTAGDFDLNSTYSELGFDQSANLTLNLNIENERDSSKSDEVKSTDPPRLKSDLEIQTIDFSLGDIEVEQEPMGTLPSEILNEDAVESPRLETAVPICLKSSKTSEMGIDQTGIEPEMTDFVALTSGVQEDKLCSLVADEVSPAETGMPLLEMQDVPPVAEVLLQTEYIKSRASDMSQLSCGARNVQSQAAECMASLLSGLKETSVEVGGSGDNELYIIKNEIQASAGELSKSDEVESNDYRCEINSKLASELIESSAEQLVSAKNINANI